jgi:hypothetical protein
MRIFLLGIVLGGCGDCGLGACLLRSRIFLMRLCELELFHFPIMGIGSADTSLLPKGDFALTILIYFQAMLGIRIRISLIRMFMGLPDLDPLVRVIPFSHKDGERTEIMLENSKILTQNFSIKLNL